MAHKSYGMTDDPKERFFFETSLRSNDLLEGRELSENYSSLFEIIFWPSRRSNDGRAATMGAVKAFLQPQCGRNRTSFSTALSMQDCKKKVDYGSDVIWFLQAFELLKVECTQCVCEHVAVGHSNNVKRPVAVWEDARQLRPDACRDGLIELDLVLAGARAQCSIRLLIAFHLAARQPQGLHKDRFGLHNEQLYASLPDRRLAHKQSRRTHCADWFPTS